ncbi:hypothetical protein AVEN_42540-1 [Araneus ventricosus]|uniref:Uncharacterized protein n=1 Tax=Araneus ventricosus TaxID=182803 RepID=A0A4Y2SRU6_ARAVE|nr:hypothetical protein AVEN_42540-1 [Araneus ventricosus]
MSFYLKLKLLKSVQWLRLGLKDINEATNLLQNSIIEACNKSYRIKNQNLSPTPNWYTKDLEVGKTRLKALRRRAQRAPKIREMPDSNSIKKN